jgi:hypothetical protein
MIETQVETQVPAVRQILAEIDALNSGESVTEESRQLRLAAF